VNLDLIKDWSVKMKSKKKQKKLHGDFQSRHALSTEVKHALELLHLSGNWAFHLGEDVAHLLNSMDNVADRLEELVTTYEEDMNLEQQKKIRAMLGRVRKYYRQMHNDSEPLSVLGIVEDLQPTINELTQELGRVLANASDR
jgi:uncharacterized protein Yka (UPF0111/DUF47 family)